MTTQNSTQTENQTHVDPRPGFATAADQYLALVDRLGSDDWTRATGSSDFDVAALCGHVLGVFNRVAHTLTTGSFEGSPMEYTSADFGADLRAARTRTEQVLSDDALLKGTVTVPWGESDRRDAVTAWADELVTHSWDLAVAIDAVASLDQSLAEPALARYHHKLPAGARPDWMPFADEVTVPDDASAYDRLVAFTGRDPRLALRG